eukprot:8532-Prorocentrum_minimum.AAC.1
MANQNGNARPWKSDKSMSVCKSCLNSNRRPTLVTPWSHKGKKRTVASALYALGGVCGCRHCRLTFNELCINTTSAPSRIKQPQVKNFLITIGYQVGLDDEL